MVRAVLSIVGILATVAVLVWCFGITVPQVTTLTPGLNRSVAHTVALMQGSVTENGRTPADSGAEPAAAPTTGPANAPAPAPDSVPVRPDSTPAPSPNHGPDQPEIISPYTSAHIDPSHTRVPEPSALAWVAPNPLPAHKHWTWDVGNREFTNVVVTHVDADVVTIASDSGPSQIEIALLPPDVRRELNYDPSIAEQAAAARKTAH
jgi:hypothetical protein